MRKIQKRQIVLFTKKKQKKKKKKKRVITMELCVLVWPYYLRTDKTCKSSTSANKQTSLRLASEACIPVENRFSSPACLLPCVFAALKVEQ